jgi:hypothetical protein
MTMKTGGGPPALTSVAHAKAMTKLAKQVILFIVDPPTMVAKTLTRQSDEARTRLPGDFS